MSWEGSIRRQVVQEFVDAGRRKGAREFLPDPVAELGPRPEELPVDLQKRRRIVTGRRAA